ncbi:hypothetical protein E1200_10725 [Actinomadura sp. GC306]|uniref:hypothetical protein n=1 Tax=Actinomadura sp. GC306 TaxID=2530367 RepID=UPI001044C449|nr:hypothetical protein [Actinomadura sp. GC306]TDC68747.1 hypothetical protein E1200_10725 [Actinomadura sp. GC306]
MTTGVGAVATIIGIVVGGFVGRRSEERKWVRDAKAEAFVKFLEQYVSLEIDLRDAYSEGRADAADWQGYNTALVALSLVAPREVSAAVEPMEEAIQEMIILGDGPPNHTEYERVHALMTESYSKFVNEARRSLDRKSEPLEFLVGGPPPWHMVRRWLPPSPAERQPE